MRTDYKLYGQSHSDHITEIVSKLEGCDVIIVREIGTRPQKELESRGMKVLITDGGIEDAVKRAAVI